MKKQDNRQLEEKVKEIESELIATGQIKKFPPMHEFDSTKYFLYPEFMSFSEDKIQNLMRKAVVEGSPVFWHYTETKPMNPMPENAISDEYNYFNPENEYVDHYESYLCLQKDSQSNSWKLTYQTKKV